MRGVLFFLCYLISVANSAPAYGDDGGYRGFASYVPFRNHLSRSTENSADTIHTSAGSPDIITRPSKREEDSSKYDPEPLPKKYDVLDYVPSHNHGYGGNKISEESPATPYHKVTLYGPSGGGYKVSDAYQNKQVDSYENDEHDYKDDQYSDPQPYEFGYSLKDEHGNTQHKHETSDGHGNVKGAYGFTDEHGIYRSVEYVAGKDGFRASIKTNEPGTLSQNPADVYLESESSKHP